MAAFGQALTAAAPGRACGLRDQAWERDLLFLEELLPYLNFLSFSVLITELLLL